MLCAHHQHLFVNLSIQQGDKNAMRTSSQCGDVVKMFPCDEQNAARDDK
jgi:hypothetical protein